MMAFIHPRFGKGSSQCWIVAGNVSGVNNNCPNNKLAAVRAGWLPARLIAESAVGWLNLLELRSFIFSNRLTLRLMVPV